MSQYLRMCYQEESLKNKYFELLSGEEFSSMFLAICRAVVSCSVEVWICCCLSL